MFFSYVSGGQNIRLISPQASPTVHCGQLPADEVTRELIQLTNQRSVNMCEQLLYCVEHEESASGKRIDYTDLCKYRVILSNLMISCKRADEAVPHLRHLAGTYGFSAWALDLLAKYEKDMCDG